MANGLLAVTNLAKSGSVTLSGGSWSGGKPLTNMLTLASNVVAQSSDASTSSTRFDIAFADTTYARAFGLLFGNFSVNATVRIQTSSSATFAVIENDSGDLDVFGGEYSWEILEWEDNNWWTGKPLDDEIDLFDRRFIFIAPQNWSFRYVRFLISDTGNSDGSIKIGRLFIARTWQFEYNMAYPFERGFESQSLSDRSFGGVQWFDERNPISYVRFSLDFMSVDESMTRALDFNRRADIYNEVLFVYDPDDTAYSSRRDIFGYLRQLNPVEQYQYGLNRTTFEIEKKL
jgi:hypothetical protein